MPLLVSKHTKGVYCMIFRLFTRFSSDNSCSRLAHYEYKAWSYSLSRSAQGNACYSYVRASAQRRNSQTGLLTEDGITCHFDGTCSRVNKYEPFRVSETGGRNMSYCRYWSLAKQKEVRT